MTNQFKKIRKTAHPITFSLYGSDLPAAWLFAYLGVVLHSFNDASEAWKARLNLGVKAWHSLRSTFCAFPYVPLDRVWHLTQSLVFSVYLYGAELWGPFVLHN